MCLNVLTKILGRSEVQQHIVILAMIFLDTLMSWLQRELTFVWVAVQKEENLPGAPVVTLAVFRLIQNLNKKKKAPTELPLSWFCSQLQLEGGGPSS